MRKDELMVQKGSKYSTRYSWKDVCLKPLPFSYLLHDLGKCFVLFFFFFVGRLQSTGLQRVGHD